MLSRKNFVFLFGNPHFISTLTPRDQNFQVPPEPSSHKDVIFSFLLFFCLQNYKTSRNFPHGYLTRLSKVCSSQKFSTRHRLCFSAYLQNFTETSFWSVFFQRILIRIVRKLSKKLLCSFLSILCLRGSRGANLSKPLKRFTLSPGTNKPPTPPKSDFKNINNLI